MHYYICKQEAGAGFKELSYRTKELNVHIFGSVALLIVAVRLMFIVVTEYVYLEHRNVFGKA